MATLVGGALQTAFAALSFWGWVSFQKPNKDGYEDEVERHEIRGKRQEIADADAEIKQTGKSLDLYKKK